MKVIVREKIDREDILGKFATEEDFDLLIDEDCDLYDLNPLFPDKKDEENIIFKFRKGVFTKEECELAYQGLREAAVESQNRGIAAGPRGDVLGAQNRGYRDWVTPYQLEVIDYFSNTKKSFDDLLGNKTVDDFPTKSNVSEDDVRGYVWLRSKVEPTKYGEYGGWFDRWVEKTKLLSKEEQIKEASIVKNFISTTNYAQSVMSGIAGYFDRYPRIPYGRACTYNENNPEKFALSFPYLRKLNSIFQKELPNRWQAQKDMASKLDPKFLIDETVFTTLTVNYNWRTAGHRDAGDLSSGFSNISGIGKGWKGCYFTLPEWRIGVNLQPGDLLLVSNHEGIHTNTAFLDESPDRVSIVAYFRENMTSLKSFDYENLRREFIERRRKDKSHPLQRSLWNGVSPNCFSDNPNDDQDWEAAREWYDFLRSNPNSEKYVGLHHPWLKDHFEGGGSLDSFFE